MASLRGRIINTNRPINVCNPTQPVDDKTAVVASGPLPRIVVYVKTGSCRMRNEWAKAVRDLGIVAITVQATCIDDGHAYVTAFDVAASPQSLETLTAMPCIKEWHFVLDVRVPVQAAGASTADMPKRQVRPIDARLIASVQHAMRNDVAIAGRANVLTTLERHAELGI
jgi:hypothetical protein